MGSQFAYSEHLLRLNEYHIWLSDSSWQKYYYNTWQSSCNAVFSPFIWCMIAYNNQMLWIMFRLCSWKRGCEWNGRSNFALACTREALVPRISVKMLQARLLRSELPSRLFKRGCLRGSLEQAHSLSLTTTLPAPCRPDSLAAGLRHRANCVSASVLEASKKRVLLFEKCCDDVCHIVRLIFRMGKK